MYCLVIPFGRKTFDDIGYTYFVRDEFKDILKPGMIVEISLKDELTYGIVYDFFDEKNINFDISKIKPILSIKNNFIFIQGYRLEILKYISKKYFTPIHNSLSLFLPKNLIEKSLKDKLKLDFNKYNYSTLENFKLNNDQENAYQKIVSGNNNKTLLFGITGSGKTHIYIKLINESVLKGKQVLLLIPEIILGNQIYSSIKKYFGDDVILINSTVTNSKKAKYFLDISSGNAKIIIGTRSSIFYPFKNLDLIIMDEEHDNSYVSEQSPRYNSIDIVNKITDLNKNKLVLGSGTPSVETMYKGLNGEYQIVNLLNKYKNN